MFKMIPICKRFHVHKKLRIFIFSDKPVIKINPLMVVNETDIIVMTGKIDSNPLANISWYDGERLLKTRTSTHTAILVLQNVSCLDTKNYTLVVSNVLQENVTAIVELIVNCKLQWYFKSSKLTKPHGMWCTLRILSANKKKLCNLKLKLKTLQTWFIWYFCQRLHYILMVVGLIYTCTCSFDFKLFGVFFHAMVTLYLYVIVFEFFSCEYMTGSILCLILYHGYCKDQRNAAIIIIRYTMLRHN